MPTEPVNSLNLPVECPSHHRCQSKSWHCS